MGVAEEDGVLPADAPPALIQQQRDFLLSGTAEQNAKLAVLDRQLAEVFQSSIISWSSNTMDDGTVDSSHRTGGSLQDSA